ncbi:Protein of unknown function DUF4451 [Ceraceosorus bombacis]|uniref:Transcription regulator Rua1 C-terminal domain-containing protein n=1 Tax=Ceraceosorus bombacis TaxID=401625 RepID=A0A0P1BNJ8_9BASI|nr:Protein of unknown function DUF4451 [Ceraceosorus bombacis]
MGPKPAHGSVGPEAFCFGASRRPVRLRPADSQSRTTSNNSRSLHHRPMTSPFTTPSRSFHYQDALLPGEELLVNQSGSIPSASLASLEAHTAPPLQLRNQDLQSKNVARDPHGFTYSSSEFSQDETDQQHSLVFSNDSLTQSATSSYSARTHQTSAVMVNTRDRSSSNLSGFLGAYRSMSRAQSQRMPETAPYESHSALEPGGFQGIVADGSLKRRSSAPGPSVNPLELCSGEDELCDQPGPIFGLDASLDSSCFSSPSTPWVPADANAGSKSSISFADRVAFATPKGSEDGLLCEIDSSIDSSIGSRSPSPTPSGAHRNATSLTPGKSMFPLRSAANKGEDISRDGATAFHVAPDVEFNDVCRTGHKNSIAGDREMDIATVLLAMSEQSTGRVTRRMTQNARRILDDIQLPEGVLHCLESKQGDGTAPTESTEKQRDPHSVKRRKIEKTRRISRVSARMFNANIEAMQGPPRTLEPSRTERVPQTDATSKEALCSLTGQAAGGRIEMRIFPTNLSIHDGFVGWYRRFPISSALSPAVAETVYAEARSPGSEMYDAAKRGCKTFGSQHTEPSPLDLYSPRWVRGVGATKEGLCPICYEVGEVRWYKTKISGEHAYFGSAAVQTDRKEDPAYNYHMQNSHGISALTGEPFDPPIGFKVKSRPHASALEKPKVLAGQFIDVEGPKLEAVKVPEIYWWKHAQKCHKDKARLEGVSGTFIENALYRRIMQYLAEHPESEEQGSC